MSPPVFPGSARLRGWERAGLVAFAVLVLAFGGLVELRSAFQQQRKTDFGVYARAAYAVRSGEDLYEVCDNNGWHYTYPAAFAVVMVPLADPWPWMDRAGYLPYELSVGLWFVLNVLACGWAVHRLANVAVPDAVRGSRRWWYARTIPTIVCIGAIGCTLARGQVNLLVVALVAGMFAAVVGGRRVRAGAWLAAAITLKIIPAVLLLIPFVRRDWRIGAGLTAGLAIGLLFLPAAAIGWERTADANRTILDAVLRPATTGGGDQLRAKELTSVTATDNQSFAAVVHAWRYPDPATRPDQADRSTKLVHLALAGLLATAALVVGWRRVGLHPADQLVYFGCVALLMVLMSPVSHMHYYAFALPLVAGLWARGLAARPGSVFADRTTTAVLAGWGLVTGLALLPLPVFAETRTFGLCTAVTWACGSMPLSRSPPDRWPSRAIQSIGSGPSLGLSPSGWRPESRRISFPRPPIAPRLSPCRPTHHHPSGPSAGDCSSSSSSPTPGSAGGSTWP